MKVYSVAPFLLQGTLWQVIMKPFFKFFGRLSVSGYERIQNLDAPVIFALNHSNSVDPVLLPLALPLWSKFSPVFFVSREAQYYSGWRKIFFSIFNARLIGALSLSHNKKDYASALEKHISVLNDGRSICIFPEGQLTKTGEIGPAHGGVTFLCEATQRPIVPVLIRGTYRMTVGGLLSKQNSISVEFLDPISPEAIRGKFVEKETRYKDIADEIMQRIAKEKNRTPK